MATASDAFLRRWADEKDHKRFIALAMNFTRIPYKSKSRLYCNPGAYKGFIIHALMALEDYIDRLFLLRNKKIEILL